MGLIIFGIVFGVALIVGAGFFLKSLVTKLGDVSGKLDKYHADLNQLPNRVVQSVSGTANNAKGKLSELIGYISLSAGYDKVIPFHDITDFVCIRFPKGDDPGSIDFVDIKNGKSAKLSPDQYRLKKIIEQKHIKFIKIQIDTDVGPENRPVEY